MLPSFAEWKSLTALELYLSEYFLDIMSDCSIVCSTKIPGDSTMSGGILHIYKKMCSDLFQLQAELKEHINAIANKMRDADYGKEECMSLRRCHAAL